jgi:hypothetical protein
MVKQKFNTYWGGYLFSPTQTLNKCPDYIDTVIVAFIGPDKNSQVETKFVCKIFPKNQIITWIRKLKKRKIKVLLGILDTPETHWDVVDFEIFGKSLRKTMIDWEVDGFDIDAESGEERNFVESFVKLIDCVRKVIGYNKTLSYTCYEGKYGFDSQIFERSKSKIDYIQLMAYFDTTEEMEKLYDYYKFFFNDNIYIGVKAGEIKDQGTPINEVMTLCQWNKDKLGIMLWTFNRDNFSFTRQNEWLWCNTIKENLNKREDCQCCIVC